MSFFVEIKKEEKNNKLFFPSSFDWTEAGVEPGDHPTQNCSFCPFFSGQEMHLLRRGTAVSLYDHIKQETFQTRTSTSPQRQAQVKLDSSNNEKKQEMSIQCCSVISYEMTKKAISAFMYV